MIAWQPAAKAQTMDDVHLFQSFFRDAPIAATPYGEAVLDFYDYEYANMLGLGLQGGIPITPKFELGTGIYYHSYSFEATDADEGGLADIPVFGRYNIYSQGTKFSVGGFVTLPVGSEDIGEQDLDLGFFGAVRHPLNNQFVLTGNLGINFVESYDDDHEAGLSLGAGVIYQASTDLHLIGELAIKSERDYAALSGGVDYKLPGVGRLRGALILGLDDGAPDIGLSAGFGFDF